MKDNYIEVRGTLTRRDGGSHDLLTRGQKEGLEGCGGVA